MQLIGTECIRRRREHQRTQDCKNMGALNRGVTVPLPGWSLYHRRKTEIILDLESCAKPAIAVAISRAFRIPFHLKLLVCMSSCQYMGICVNTTSDLTPQSPLIRTHDPDTGLNLRCPYTSLESLTTAEGTESRSSAHENATLRNVNTRFEHGTNMKPRKNAKVKSSL